MECMLRVRPLAALPAARPVGAAHDFGPDTTLVIPPNVVHQIVNVGDEPMCLTAVFATSPVEVFLPDGQPLPLPWAT